MADTWPILDGESPSGRHELNHCDNSYVSVRPSDIKTDNLFSLVLCCSSEYTKQKPIYTTVEPCR